MLIGAKNYMHKNTCPNTFEPILDEKGTYYFKDTCTAISISGGALSQVQIWSVISLCVGALDKALANVSIRPQVTC